MMCDDGNLDDDDNDDARGRNEDEKEREVGRERQASGRNLEACALLIAAAPCNGMQVRENGKSRFCKDFASRR